MWDKEKSQEPAYGSQANTSAGIAPGEIILGTVEGINAQGQPLVQYPENPHGEPRSAVSTLAIGHQHKGRQVALLFAQGDPAQPVIMGLIHNPLTQVIEEYELQAQGSESPAAKNPGTGAVDEVNVDGKRIVFEGKEEIVLKCGEASITLTNAGKIVIRGKYLLNRSSGINRIMGGSVQVN